MVNVRHVGTDDNPADLFTKHLDSQRKLDELLEMFNCKVRSGRPEAAPKLKTASASACVARVTPATDLSPRAPGGDEERE